MFSTAHNVRLYKSLLLPLVTAGTTETGNQRDWNTRYKICVTFAGKVKKWLLYTLSCLRNVMQYEEKKKSGRLLAQWLSDFRQAKFKPVHCVVYLTNGGCEGWNGNEGTGRRSWLIETAVPLFVSAICGRCHSVTSYSVGDRWMGTEPTWNDTDSRRWECSKVPFGLPCVYTESPQWDAAQ